MTDYRIAQTLRTAANNQLCAGCRPVQDKVAMIRTKWDKKNRTAWEALPTERTFPGICAQKRAFLSFLHTLNSGKNNVDFLAI
jgi:hypothetical protein